MHANTITAVVAQTTTHTTHTSAAHTQRARTHAHKRTHAAAERRADAKAHGHALGAVLPVYHSFQLLLFADVLGI
jgi:hypothetical protein